MAPEEISPAASSSDGLTRPGSRRESWPPENPRYPAQRARIQAASGTTSGSREMLL